MKVTLRRSVVSKPNRRRLKRQMRYNPSLRLRGRLRKRQHLRRRLRVRRQKVRVMKQMGKRSQLRKVWKTVSWIG